MERRATADDRARADDTRDSTRPMRSEPTPAAYENSGYATKNDPGYVEERRVVPGTARGRLHVGINWGAAFFGWVAAMGLAVLLTSFVVAVGTAVGVTQGATTVDEAASRIQENQEAAGVLGVIVLAVIAFISYYGGGYVAARMSRFDGARQGFAVWLWAVVVAIVVAIVAAVAGARFDVLSTLNTFPRIPVNQGSFTVTGIVALVLLLAITLLGAVIGGAGGMRYHRRLETAEAEYLE
jgi:amino acid transporter